MNNSLLSSLKLGNLINALRMIDAEVEKERAALPGRDYRPAVAIAVSAFSLMLFHYMTTHSAFYSFLKQFSLMLGEEPSGLLLELGRAKFFPLYIYLWWILWGLISCVLLPVLTIKLVFRQPVRDYGFAIAGTKAYLKWYMLLFSAAFFIMILLSFRQDFLSYYPFYDSISRSRADFIAWEVICFVQVLSVEFFFRGFMLKSFKAAMGSNAIFVMCLPYMMIHLPKPMLESVFSLFLGFFLGVLAMRSRSIWGGVFVHFFIGAGMDFLALVQKNSLPGQWLP